MSGLGLTFLRRGGQAHPTAGSDYILSEERGDPEVFRILMEKGVSSDGIGITKDDAAKVTSISNWFIRSTITNFDEFEFFTGVKTIANTADNNAEKSPFYACANLTSIRLPKSLTTLGDFAFADCTALVNIECDWESINFIGRNAFRNCTNVEFGDVVLSNISTLYFGAFYKCDKLRSIEIRGNVTALGGSSWVNGVFESCKGLKRVVLPESLTTIGRQCFRYCTALAECDIPSSVTKIIGDAFAECTALSGKLYLPNLSELGINAFYSTSLEGVKGLGNIAAIGTTEWGNMTFDACKSLKYVVTPASLTSIGRYPFRNCTALEVVCLLATTPPTLTSTTAFNNTTCSFYVPDDSVAAYQETSVWSSLASRIKPISQLPTDNPTIYEEIKDYL